MVPVVTGNNIHLAVSIDITNSHKLNPVAAIESRRRAERLIIDHTTS